MIPAHLQQLPRLLRTSQYDLVRARVEVARDEVGEERGDCGGELGGLEERGAACGECAGERGEQEDEGEVPGPVRGEMVSVRKLWCLELTGR